MYLEMRLHHINISCCDIELAKWKFSRFGFYEYGQLSAKDTCRENTEFTYVLRHRNVFLTLKRNRDGSVDTIDDVAFCVASVSQCCDDVTENGGLVLQKAHYVDCVQRDMSVSHETCCNCKTLQCSNYIERAVIKSPIGNIQHTLLNKLNFTGDFLPGFICSNTEVNDLKIYGIDKIDHIALAVPKGEAIVHMNWYKDCLKMLHFKMSVDESGSGVIIKEGGNGLRLLTLVEYPCSDNILSQSVDEIGVGNDQLKLVFCESLFNEG